MKKSRFVLLILLVSCLVLVLNSCTENERAKSWGGTTTIYVESSEKLVNVTWKDNEIWLLTRARKPNEAPETYKFFEKSAWGVLEGTVFIKER